MWRRNCRKQRGTNELLVESLEASNDACEYMMQEHSRTWVRSFYDEVACCQHMNDNFSESFSNAISELRDNQFVRWD